MNLGFRSIIENNIKFIDNDAEHVIIEEDNVIYRSFFKRNKNGKREVRLEISTFRGTCFGAVHYYGTLNISNPEFHIVESKNDNYKVGDVIWSNTLMRNDAFKNFCNQIELQKLKDGNYIGNGFDSVGEVIDLAKDIFEKYFIGDWKLVIEPFEKNQQQIDGD